MVVEDADFLDGLVETGILWAGLLERIETAGNTLDERRTRLPTLKGLVRRCK